MPLKIIFYVDGEEKWSRESENYSPASVILVGGVPYAVVDERYDPGIVPDQPGFGQEVLHVYLTRAA